MVEFNNVLFILTNAQLGADKEMSQTTRAKSLREDKQKGV